MLTAKETQAAQAFWKWFEENRLPFEFLGEMAPEQRQGLFDQLEQRASAYCEGIDIQLGSNMAKDGPKHRVVVSAAGQIRFFDKAKALAALAPEMPDWIVFALLPPLPKGIQIRFDLSDGLLYPNDLWFLLMDSPDEPKFLGIHIALKQYDQYEATDRLDDLQQIVIQMVVHIIGEESWAMDIQHLQLGSLPPDPIEEGYFEMYDLPEQIAEFRKDRPSPKLGELEG